ncbi:MarR family transcriptional regulator [Sebaldella sp. S0638]|uniref:MarR family transcriptional regulator n=1 Tax=Sebaldella sp. S0638 TaxID=2957809 RepID=UPI00209E8093|nr:MarR family transcriptional regulator [Sebaldella sp. S0638]MCP1226174.1 MarR family transcriptional regulator [Sebaldella sp. S0638]
MKKQYKEYKVFDKDISEFVLPDEQNFYSYEEFKIETIEDIDDINIADLKEFLNEKIETGAFIDFLEKLCRNRLLKIIPMLVLDEKEFFVYDSFYKNKETQSEIGKKLGVTRQSVNKVVKKINDKFDYAGKNITLHYYEEIM